MPCYEVEQKPLYKRGRDFPRARVVLRLVPVRRVVIQCARVQQTAPGGPLAEYDFLFLGVGPLPRNVLAARDASPLLVVPLSRRDMPSRQLRLGVRAKSHVRVPHFGGWIQVFLPGRERDDLRFVCPACHDQLKLRARNSLRLVRHPRVEHVKRARSVNRDVNRGVGKRSGGGHRRGGLLRRAPIVRQSAPSNVQHLSRGCGRLVHGSLRLCLRRGEILGDVVRGHDFHSVCAGASNARECGTPRREDTRIVERRVQTTFQHFPF